MPGGLAIAVAGMLTGLHGQDIVYLTSVAGIVQDRPEDLAACQAGLAIAMARMLTGPSYGPAGKLATALHHGSSTHQVCAGESVKKLRS